VESELQATPHSINGSSNLPLNNKGPLTLKVSTYWGSIAKLLYLRYLGINSADIVMMEHANSSSMISKLDE